MKRRFLSVFFAVSAVAFAQPKAAPPTATAPTATVTKVWPLAPKGDIQILVRQAMESARRGGNGNYDKATEVGERSAEALPFLEPYSRDQNDDVRFAVMLIAQNSHSARALQLLSNVLVRPSEASDVSSHALKAIAQFYTRTELAKWGGANLRERLMKLARRDENFAEAILVLPAFSEAKTRIFLRKLRFSPSKTALTVDEFSPRVARSFACDLALCEAGDNAAFARSKREIGKNRVAERVWLCQAWPFVQNRRILQLTASFLSDQRVAKERIMFAMGTDGVCRQRKLAPLRVCDVAARSLEFKKNGQRYGDLYSGEPLTAEEIKRHQKDASKL